MLRHGQTVEFRVYDSLFKKWINAIGVIKHRFINRLWIISAKDQPGLQTDFEQWVHEDNVNA